MIKQSLLALTLLISASATWAEDLKTITLSVDKMTCGTCPITVRHALNKVEGVKSAKASYDGDGIGWATVTYDAETTDVEDLTFATEMAGYPSRLKK